MRHRHRKSRLVIQQKSLDRNASTVIAHGTAFFDHTMTGYDDADRVGAHGWAGCTTSSGISGRGRQIRVRDGLAEWRDFRQIPQALPAKCGVCGYEKNIDLSGEEVW